MTTYVALLRAVNVAGQNPLAMAALCEFASQLGLAGARTLLHSGNSVFHTATAGAADLERLLEAESEGRLRLRTDFFVRAAAEWRAIVTGNPFAEQATRDPAHLVVMLLKHAPDATHVESLRASIAGKEVVAIHGRHLYAVYPDGMGRSRLTAALIERTLRTRVTARNWNTVSKLAAAMAG